MLRVSGRFHLKTKTYDPYWFVYYYENMSCSGNSLHSCARIIMNFNKVEITDNKICFYWILIFLIFWILLQTYAYIIHTNCSIAHVCKKGLWIVKYPNCSKRRVVLTMPIIKELSSKIGFVKIRVSIFYSLFLILVAQWSTCALPNPCHRRSIRH